MGNVVEVQDGMELEEDRRARKQQAASYRDTSHRGSGRRTGLLGGSALVRTAAGTALVLILAAGVTVGAAVEPANAATFNVANEADLRNAIFTANSNGDPTNTINITGNIALTQSLPMITRGLTVNGGGNTIDAQNNGRVFFIQAGTASISNVTIDNAHAQGGAGGHGGGGGGGGGGLGAGAAVFVNAGADVTVSNITLGTAAASGGSGGGGGNNGSSGGGGGGLAGAGGDSGFSGGGGGGYEGAGGDGDGTGGGGGGGEFGAGGRTFVIRGPGPSVNVGGGGGGGGGATDGGADTTSTAGGAAGGAQGGGGGGDGFPGSDAAADLGGGGGGGRAMDGGIGGIGGGGGGSGFIGLLGGDGGDFGGGGGGEIGGAGGFGGGGGAGRSTLSLSYGGAGGAGGFGAGGGGGTDGGAGGSFAGQGGNSGATADGADGGGGAALGGAIFVRDGGQLTVVDGDFVGTYGVTGGGTGGTGGATAGQAQGRKIFLHDTASTDLRITSGSRSLSGADALAGDGTLIKSGDGTLAIDSANANFLGNVTLNGGTLSLGDSDALGSAAITTNNGSTVAYDDGIALTNNITVDSDGAQLQVANGTATQAGNITETGGANPLEKTGAGTLILTGNASHTGGTTVSAGTMQVGDGGTSGSLNGDVTNNGTLAFNRSDAIAFGGTISGTGSLIQAGDGPLVLTGNADHSGGTTVSAGSLQVGDGGTSGSLNGDVTNNATLAFNRSDAVTFGGAISGTGGLTQAGTGSLILTGPNSFSGGVILQQGTLLLGSDGAAGSGTITTNGSTLGYADGVNTANAIAVASNSTQLQVASGTATQTGNITETGGSRPLEKTGAGLLILTGNASHTGGTTVSAGTLRLGASERLADGGAVTVANDATFDVAGFTETIGSLHGDGTLSLDGGSLAFAGAGSGGFSGAVSGTGNMTLGGSGTQVFDGTVAASITTAITGGTVIVNGTLGDVTVGTGGTLGGTGILGALTANGRVAPGNSIGTLNSGSVTFDPGSVLAVEIAPDGRADLLNVTGTATVNGGNVEVTPQAGGYSHGQEFLILQTTGGVGGTFDSVNYAPGQVLALLDPSLQHEANDVFLLLSRNSQDFEGTTSAPDLKSTGSALDDLEENPTPSSGPLIQELLGLTDAELNGAVRQLSGSGLTGGAQLAQLAGQTFLAIIPTGSGGNLSDGVAGLTQFARAETGAGTALNELGLAAAGGPEKLEQSGPRFWFEALGGFGSRDGEDAAADQNRYYAGAAGGVVLPLNEEVSLSLGLGGFGGQVSTDDGLAETDSTSLLAAAKLTWSPGPWQLSGSLGFAGHRFKSEREVHFAGFDQTAEGKRDGYEVLGDLAVGYDWQLSGVTLTPTAGLGASWLYQESWSESGAGGANLEIDSSDTLSLQPRLGVGVASDVDLGQGLTLTPRAQALWIGRLGDETTDTTARFAGSDASWRVPGLEEPDHSAALSLGADLTSKDRWALSAGYAGRFGEGARDHGFLLGGWLKF